MVISSRFNRNMGYDQMNEQQRGEHIRRTFANKKRFYNFIVYSTTYRSKRSEWLYRIGLMETRDFIQ